MYRQLNNRCLKSRLSNYKDLVKYRFDIWSIIFLKYIHIISLIISYQYYILDNQKTSYYNYNTKSIIL